eukprot:12917855-Prorocentrum_lima.AAC.1
MLPGLSGAGSYRRRLAKASYPKTLVPLLQALDVGNQIKPLLAVPHEVLNVTSQVRTFKFQLGH